MLQFLIGQERGLVVCLVLKWLPIIYKIQFDFQAQSDSFEVFASDLGDFFLSKGIFHDAVHESEVKKC